VELCDAAGRVLTRVQVQGDFCDLDMRGLPTGSYALTVRDVVGKAMFVGKVVKP
jgi:hypothetical protein